MSDFIFLWKGKELTIIIFHRLLTFDQATGKVYMVPMASDDDLISETSDDEMMNMIKTGQLPENLLNDILAEAGNYMSIYNYNPSKFLKK